MLKGFYKISAKLKDLITLVRTSLRDSYYRIEELDTNTGQVVLYHRKTRTLIKTTITEAITDLAIIDTIHPFQACWLGYYHGKALREGKLKHSSSKMNFLLRPSKERYNIVALDHRNFKITYVDIKTRTEYEKPIVELAQDEIFLENTSPSQACYIGIWTGIAVAKHGTTILQTVDAKLPSYLRIVK